VGAVQELPDGLIDIKNQLLKIYRTMHEGDLRIIKKANFSKVEDALAIEQAVLLPKRCCAPQARSLRALHCAPVLSPPYSLQALLDAFKVGDCKVQCNCNVLKTSVCTIETGGVCAEIVENEYAMAMTKGKDGGGYEDEIRDEVISS